MINEEFQPLQFLKIMFKLLLNSVYGRTLYNHRNRKLFILALCQKAFERNSGKLTVKDIKLLAHNVALFYHQQQEVRCDFPTIVGASVLELSKLHMYQSYYKGFKKNLSNVSLLYMDTDSFVMQVTTEHFVEEMKSIQNTLMDCSNLPASHPLYDVSNQGILGKFKSETPTAPIEEAVFLKSKMYSVKLSNGQNIKRAKGVKRYVVNKELIHQSYLNVLRTSEDVYKEMRSIQPRNFENFSVKIV